MIFVPLTLVATLCLVAAFAVVLRRADMTVRANQLFAVLVGLYAMQSALLTVRWGYGVLDVAPVIALLAPALPAVAYLAYLSLNQRQARLATMFVAGVVLLNWVAYAVARDLADGAILLTYLGIGGLILIRAYRGRADMALVRLEQAYGAWLAMVLTGAALVASGLVDVFIIVDFIRTDGQNVGLTIALIQTAFVLCIGLAAFFSAGGTVAEESAADVLQEADQLATQADDAIIADLRRLFDEHALHRDTDLNLRRLGRRLGLPDRAVSQAINRTQGESVSQYVNGFRIADACTLLRTTDQSVLQISLAAGFMTKSNFNREFVRVTGQTPSAWRKASRLS
ncbi:helix-turn-helix domain-containing protein [Yoonia sp. 208BN28-4]|uniref:helix-turn-helix domain-containing protein n=1 Tax=Yoonia sp. 208BN28-4 TaxID=3126505 RepID=UPI0030A60923